MQRFKIIGLVFFYLLTVVGTFVGVAVSNGKINSVKGASGVAEAVPTKATFQSKYWIVGYDSGRGVDFKHPRYIVVKRSAGELEMYEIPEANVEVFVDVPEGATVPLPRHFAEWDRQNQYAVDREAMFAALTGEIYRSYRDKTWVDPKLHMVAKFVFTD